MAEDIKDVAAGLLAALDKAKTELQDFSATLEARQKEAFFLLAAYERRAAEAGKKASGGAKAKNAVSDALQTAVGNLGATIKNWQQSIEGALKGEKFMHDHEKYLAVMVFGAVKSGKSTLGNFLAGREWLAAPFPNVYKELPETVFATQEKGRDTGDVERGTDGRTWFKEGLTDTTGDIQYFTLSGLRWFDSPGTGAIAKAGDRRDMEQMVNEYLQYVDFCLFLVNSSEPGLLEDMKYIKKLSRDEQAALVVITRSDDVTEDLDADGNLVQTHIAKSAKNRKLQEDDMCQRLQKAYPEIAAEKYRAISISSLLAQEAVRENDAAKFEASGLPRLYGILTERAAGGVVPLKERGPKKALNAFVNTILEGGEQTQGLDAVEKSLAAITEAAKKYRAQIKSRAELIKRRVARELSARAGRELSSIKGEASGESLARRVFDFAQPVIADACNAEMERILGTTQAVTREMRANIARPALQAQDIQSITETFTTSYEQSEFVERDPEGFIENLRSFFGKKYGSFQTVEKTLSTDIDLGTNKGEVVEQLLPQIEDYAAREAEKMLRDMQENFFAPQEAYAKEMRAAAQELRQKLEALRLN